MTSNIPLNSADIILIIDSEFGNSIKAPQDLCFQLKTKLNSRKIECGDLELILEKTENYPSHYEFSILHDDKELITNEIETWLNNNYEWEKEKITSEEGSETTYHLINKPMKRQNI